MSRKDSQVKIRTEKTIKKRTASVNIGSDYIRRFINAPVALVEST
jgi:hypothetical protein